MKYSFWFFYCFKNNFSFQDLESLNDEQLEEIMAITDDQAIHSDIGGDSDADDCFIDVVSNTSSYSTHSCSHQSLSSSEPPHGSLSSNILPPALPPAPPSQLSPPPPTALRIHHRLCCHCLSLSLFPYPFL